MRGEVLGGEWGEERCLGESGVTRGCLEEGGGEFREKTRERERHTCINAFFMFNYVDCCCLLTNFFKKEKTFN